MCTEAEWFSRKKSNRGMTGMGVLALGMVEERVGSSDTW